MEPETRKAGSSAKQGGGKQRPYGFDTKCRRDGAAKFAWRYEPHQPEARYRLKDGAALIVGYWRC
ncbi:MAG: hypothetical protein WB630_21275 [Candidatus Acidiferrales bacterium]